MERTGSRTTACEGFALGRPDLISMTAGEGAWTTGVTEATGEASDSGATGAGCPATGGNGTRTGMSDPKPLPNREPADFGESFDCLAMVPPMH
jgi:hypothetical protein